MSRARKPAAHRARRQHHEDARRDKRKAYKPRTSSPERRRHVGRFGSQKAARGGGLSRIVQQAMIRTRAK